VSDSEAGSEAVRVKIRPMSPVSDVRRGIVVVFFTAAAFFAVSGRASAVTVDQIVRLTKAGVSEPVILALIDRDRNVFSIDPEQIVSLRQQGVSEPVLIAMLKSGRVMDDAAPRTATSTPVPATTAPEVVVVGHGPETPNGRPYSPFHETVSIVTFAVFPMLTPYVVPYGATPSTAQGAPRVAGRGPTPCASTPRRGCNLR